MGACCSLLLGKHKSYEKVTAQEGKHTGLELQEASTDLGATRKERTVSGGRLGISLCIMNKMRIPILPIISVFLEPSAP